MKSLSSTASNKELDLLDHSLRCVGHYSVVISILLLIFNDHYLKYHYPGFVSGKLSDFTGLYFFPFLIVLFLGLFTGNRTSKHRLGLYSLLFTALFFVGIKTVPWFNNQVEVVLNFLHGGFSVIVLDATDLIALPVLFLSWRLWNRDSLAHPRWSMWIVVILAAGATLATSCQWPSVIKELYLAEDRIYAVDPRMDTWFVSTDQGNTWEPLSEPPPSFKPDAERETALPKTVCDPAEGLHCFKITGEGIVEESEDGGKTWHVGWRIPPGRREFMNRMARSGICGKSVDLGPYDIEFVGESQDRKAVVAMGNEGILLLPDSGPPARISVNASTNPTPYLVKDIRAAVIMNITESSLLFFLGIVWWAVINMLYWKPVLAHLRSASPGEDRARWVIAPFRKSLIFLSVIVVLIGLITVFGFALYTDIEMVILLLLTAAALICHPVGLFLSWRRLSSVLSRPSQASTAVLSLIASGAGFLVGGFLPLYLWVMSVINHYLVAILASAFLLLVILGSSMYWIRSQVQSTIEYIKS